MTRQGYNTNATVKALEVVQSFAGGMVTQAHPEKLKDNESVLLENVDIVSGGTAQARGGYPQTNKSSVVIPGNTQGKFRYQGLASSQDLVAIGGNLYIVVSNTYTLLPITGLASFQTTRPIEAVQYRDKMYFATGSGLVVYNGTTASLVVPYAPNGLEALYLGTNGLAADPTNYLTDAVGVSNAVLGITASARYGIINQSITFTAFVQKVAGDTLDYQFETKLTSAASYTVVQAWGASKACTTSFGTKDDYMIKVSIRKNGTTPVLSEYVLPSFKVNTTPDDNPEPTVTGSNLANCNRIFVHYDRLMIYGDTTNPDLLYISHVNKFEYFPRTNSIRVTDPRRGSLQSVKQFKSFLVCFTNSSIQTIIGKSPLDYQKQTIHTTLGTKFPYSPQVMKNYVSFVGDDNGVYVLKSFNFASEDKLNVERIDKNITDNIGSLITTSTKVLSSVYNNQYYLYIENTGRNYIYRYYYETDTWVRDTLPFSIATLDNVDNVLTMASLTGGTIYKLLNDVFKDNVGQQYVMRIVSKDFNFNLPHHRKKLKEYQVLVRMTANTTVTVSLYADNTLLITAPLTYDTSQSSDAQKLKLASSGKFRYIKTEITIPVHELVQVTGFGFVFKQNTPK